MPRRRDLVHLRQGEKILALFPRSKIVLIFPFILALFFVSLPMIFFHALFQFGWLGIILFFFLVILGVLYTLRVYYIWRYSVLIITSERIIDVFQQGLLYRDFSEARFSEIKRARCAKKNILERVFFSGDVYVEEHHSNTPVRVRYMTHPEHLVDFLSEKIFEFAHGEQKGAERVYDIGELFSEVSELKDSELEDLTRELLEILSLVQRRVGRTVFKNFLQSTKK